MDVPDDFIERFEKTGDWGPTPWFLDAEQDAGWEREWQHLGLPREKRVVADAALRKIFPRESVMEIARDPRRGAGHIVALFGGIRWPGLVIGLLDLGVDAERVKPWEDPKLLSRLRQRESYADTAFEVAVHAGLLRAGAQVRRVPETSQGKTYDFEFTFRSHDYDLEAKAMHLPELEVVSDALDRALSMGDLLVPGFDVALRGSPHMVELALESPKDVEPAFPEIVRAFVDAAASLRSRAEPGIYLAGTWGQLEAERGYERGSMTPLLLPDLPQEKLAKRVHRRVVQGLKQLSGQKPGILVIGLHGAAQPDLVERLVLGDDSGANFARKCCMVVLCEEDSFSEPGFHFPRRVPLFYAFSPLRTRRLRKAERMLAAAVSSTHWAASRRMDPQQDGKISIRVGTSREPQTMYGGPSITLAKVGDSGTLTTDYSKLPPPKIRR